MQKIEIAGNVTNLAWGLGEKVLCIQKPSGIQVLSEQKVHLGACGAYLFASMIESKKLLLEFQNRKLQTLDTENKIKGIAVSKDVVACWNGNLLDVYVLGTTIFLK